MKKVLVFLFVVIFSSVISQQITQRFSSTSPSGWSSTKNSWTLNYNGNATSNFNNMFDNTKYSARLASATTGSSRYLYIPITLVYGETYTISFYTKRACSVSTLINEDTTQTTPLLNSLQFNFGCLSNFDLWYYWSTTYKATKSATAYLQIRINIVYGGPTSVYLDDFTYAKAVPLPISLLYFTASSQSTFNLLQWSTVTEVNNAHFVIEKTLDGSDYEEVGTIAGGGNSNRQLFYEERDYNLSMDVCYYRLKQVDFDGAFTYSDLVSVEGIRKKGLVVRVVNIYGVDVDINTKGLLLLIYDDNTVVKVFN